MTNYPRPAPQFAVGDWIYNDLSRVNAQVLRVDWDDNQGAWRYSVPGLSQLYPQRPRADAPYAQYRQTRGGSCSCYARI